MIPPSVAQTISPRSYLYVPGDRDDRIKKVLKRGADAIILDLDDSVIAENKSMAREIVSDWLEGHVGHLPNIWLRITVDNPADDIQAISAPIAGLIVPRAETPLLAEVDQLLSAKERALRCKVGDINVIPLVESARGLLSAEELASAPRTLRLGIGRADLAGELGLAVDPEGPEFQSILLQLVIASSAAGIAAPVAPASTDFRNLDALRASTKQLMRLGFRGRTAVHPAQLAVINAVFTPTPGEIERASRLVSALDAARRDGSGVTTDENGGMVDAAIVRSAREVLARAGDTNLNR